MRAFLKGFVLPMAIFIAALEILIRIPHDSIWYDATMGTLVVGAVVGSIVCGCKMSKHFRDIRIYKQVRAEMPLGVWPLVPKPLEPKNLPRWIMKVAAKLTAEPGKNDPQS